MARNYSPKSGCREEEVAGPGTASVGDSVHPSGRREAAVFSSGLPIHPKSPMKDVDLVCVFLFCRDSTIPKSQYSHSLPRENKTKAQRGEGVDNRVN